MWLFGPGGEAAGSLAAFARWLGSRGFAHSPTARASKAGAMTDSYQPDFRHLRAAHRGIEEYGRFQQHLVLLEDATRLGAYFAAIDAAARAGARKLLEIGGGTGILSLYALKAGFDSAIVFEPSKKIANYARHVFASNGVAERVTIIEEVFETFDHASLPFDIDLVLTETISSIVVGFGSWDAMGALRSHLSKIGSFIPSAGTVSAALSEKVYALRNTQNGGLKLIADAGLNVDLFFRAFRSGGNVFPKDVVTKDIEAGILRPADIISFNLMAPQQFQYHEPVLRFDSPKVFTGLTAYWDIALSAHDPNIEISSLDPRLFSWFPFYIPFTTDLALEQNKDLKLSLELHDLDAPYPYAIQVLGNDEPLTHMMYW
jgi:hypothetical protein